MYTRRAIVQKRTTMTVVNITHEPITTTKRAVTTSGCPRCGGFVYRHVIPFTGHLEASKCLNCGWQGEYVGATLDERGTAAASKRVFDAEEARERIRTTIKLVQKRIQERREPPDVS